MTIETLRRRIIFQLTTPPALLYTLTRHWLIVGLFFGGACAWILINSTLATPVYEGKATLMLNLQGSSVVPQNEAATRPRSTTPREEDERFLQRVEMLKGDSVLRKLAGELRDQLAAQPPEDAPGDDAQGTFRKLLSDVRRTVRAALKSFQGEEPEQEGEEYLIQTAIKAFQEGSSVVPHAETSTVELHVFGPNRDLIRLQLSKWIDAYKDRLEELAKETQKNYLQPRMKKWLDDENAAKSDLDSFKEEFPDVTKAKQDLLFQEILGLQAARTELRRPIDPSQTARTQPQVPGAALPTSSEDSVLQSMRTNRATLEQELQTALRRHPPGSDVVRAIEADLTRLNAQIVEKEEEAELRKAEQMQAAELRWRALLAADQALSQRDLDIQKAAEDERSRREKEITAAIEAGLVKYTLIARGLERLQALEESYEQAKQIRRRYVNMFEEETDRLEAQRNVEVQVRDQPEVSLTPYKTSKRKDIAMGLAGGLGMGLGLALLLEVFRNKLRFKSDILNELSVPVIGVFPRK